jgi:flagellar FliL protein
VPTEQRIISQKIGGPRPSSPSSTIGSRTPAEPPAAEKKPKKSKKLLVVVLVVVLLLGGAISINLADGHYLRLGMGLQLTKATKTAPNPARALDLAIVEFSGRTVAEVSDPATRDKMKAELLTSLEKVYKGEVMDLYLTNFVTQ